MIIVKDENKTIYCCSICRHKHTVYSDGRTEGEPFSEYNRKITSYKFWEDNTLRGKEINVPHEVEYQAYECPVCGRVQVTEEDARDINDTGYVFPVKL